MNGAVANKSLFDFFPFRLLRWIEQFKYQPSQSDQAIVDSSTIQQQEIEANYRVWLDMGRIFILDGKYEQAVVAYNRASQLQPEQDEAWLYKGIALARLEEFSAALVSLEQAIALNQANYEAKYHKVKVLQRLNQDQAAKACLVECLTEFANMANAESHVYYFPWYR